MEMIASYVASYLLVSCISGRVLCAWRIFHMLESSECEDGLETELVEDIPAIHKLMRTGMIIFALPGVQCTWELFEGLDFEAVLFDHFCCDFAVTVGTTVLRTSTTSTLTTRKFNYVGFTDQTIENRVTKTSACFHSLDDHLQELEYKKPIDDLTIHSRNQVPSMEYQSDTSYAYSFVVRLSASLPIKSSL